VIRERYYDILHGTMSRVEALKVAEEIGTQHPEWHTYLPPCPSSERAIQAHPLFERSNVAISCFHKGADNCYRSHSKVGFPSERFETDELARNHAQQCCYKAGSLITDGPGAGTPDFSNSSNQELHTRYDVLPWTLLSLNETKRAWPPNRGSGQAFRTIVFAQGKTNFNFGIGLTLEGPVGTVETTRVNWHNSHLFVSEGDVLRIKVIKGQVGIGGGLVSGPEGIKNPTPQQQLHMLLSTFVAPLIARDAPFGSLLAAVYAGGYELEEFRLDQGLLDKPFNVGKETEVEITKSGYLLLTINDALPDDNTGYFVVEIQRLRTIPLLKSAPRQ
jgi:hypothetical protein